MVYFIPHAWKCLHSLFGTFHSIQKPSIHLRMIRDLRFHQPCLQPNRYISFRNLLFLDYYFLNNNLKVLNLIIEKNSKTNKQKTNKSTQKPCFRQDSFAKSAQIETRFKGTKRRPSLKLLEKSKLQHFKNVAKIYFENCFFSKYFWTKSWRGTRTTLLLNLAL